VQPGGTTADGLFTLLPCCCLGNCGEAPTLMVGDTLHGRLTPASTDLLLAAERTDLLTGGQTGKIPEHNP
ncbi:MAG TPA: NAD(P)H-dependent oxidoreductase subunit E, partial [Geobacteraceae bacterium]